ncbi:GNAT family N-acetyltransferase [Chitinophaga vietnamensis]|uniref:GNAT family N-acetyltransferase n=1 Tax=Chitinophaga vietnamensis TaxID=2593957 RepID=UPI0011788DE7|nr:GNAT family N-acetyltransferase [Chitinophaga vietnamensis]
MQLSDISIRTTLQSGDLGYMVYRHAVLYHREYGYGLSFESYVAKGLNEFYEQYDPSQDRIWIAEHNGNIVGTLALMHRPGNAAQLRYFLIEPAYRGVGLGREMMALFMACFKERKYTSAYLWTSEEQETAASIYLRNGFQLAEEVDSTLFGKPLKERRYELAIAQDDVG